MGGVRRVALASAVAVTLGAGGLLPASASVSSGERAVFVSITPCRLTDTRAGSDNVGPRSVPLGSGETMTVAVRGVNGNCNLPADAVAVAANVATLNGTAASFLTLFPSDADRPLTANLNWVAGAPPTPNKVDVRLGADGGLKVYNLTGSVDVVIDVFGYYADHTHDDRYYTKAEVDSKVALVDAKALDGPFARRFGASIATPFPTPNVSGGSISVNVPRSSRLWVSMLALGNRACDGGAAAQQLWITVDGVPIVDSLVTTPILGPAPQPVQFPLLLQGTTTEVIAAGPHDFRVAARCASGTATGFLSASGGTFMLIED